jgi:hypothetical protein
VEHWGLLIGQLGSVLEALGHCGAHSTGLELLVVILRSEREICPRLVRVNRSQALHPREWVV